MTVEGLAAVAAVTARAEQGRADDAARVATVLGDTATAGEVAAGLRRHGRLTVNFHPDRPDRRGVPVLEGLLRDGRYRSQYETGISSGGRSAVPGGDRTGWEEHLFAGAYGDAMAGRPVYGSLDVTNDPHGGSPRFGSCALVLADHCWDRATFTVGDSHLGPADVGTWASFDAVVAGLLEDAAGGDGLGRGLDVDDLLTLVRGQAHPRPPARELDRYVECQIHGGVSLADDVVAVLLDPAFRSTPLAGTATELSQRHGVELRWNGGSVVEAASIPEDFRGPEAWALAQALADTDGRLTAADIGRSAATLPWQPPPTPSGDLPDSALQLHKQVWHCVLRFGDALV